MEYNLIPNLRFVNDRNEVLKVNTQEVVIMINGKILLRNSFDLTEQLQKIYKDAKSVKLYLNYTYIDKNMKMVGIKTRELRTNGYMIREYYNTESNKNETLYIFGDCSCNEIKELLEEYRHRQSIESINNIRIKSGLENETLVEISKSIKDLTKTIVALIGTEVK